MKLRRFSAVLFGFASFTLLTVPPAPAQQTTATAQFTDPANLRGERVKPRDGRELPIDQGSRGLEQMLRKLNTRASLMLIVAHPDDEDGGMLTYYSRGLGARVAVLTLTRGEGGQNAMTGDFEDALGLLRTQELLSADRYLGVDQFFGTEVDFGFSKTKEEAFKKWTHERVLYDAVRSIRLYRPLVIAAVFIGGVTDGHGQHQVSGQIAQEAFKAAADPTVFPDMIAEGILPWQALKVYARVPMQSISDKGLFDYATGKYTAPRFENYVTGEVTTSVPSSDVIVHEGTVDPILSDNPSDPPRTYVQFARIGLGLQKSQVGSGMRVPPSGAFDIAYHRYGSKLANQPVKETSFFDGIDTSIEGIASLAPDEVWLKEPLMVVAKTLRQSETALQTGNKTFACDGLADASLSLTKILAQMEDESSEYQNRSNLKPRLSADADEKQAERKNVLHEISVKLIQIDDALMAGLGIELTAQAEDSSALPLTNSPLRIDISASSKTSGIIFFGVSLIDQSGREVANTSSVPHPRGVTLPINTPAKRAIRLDADVISSPSRPYFSRSDIEQPVYKLDRSALRNSPVTPPALLAYSSFEFRGKIIQTASVVRNSSQPLLFIPAGSLSAEARAHVAPTAQSKTAIRLDVTPPDASVKALTGQEAVIATDRIVDSKKSSGVEQLTVKLIGNNRQVLNLRFAAVLPNGSQITEGYRSIGYGDLPRTNYYTPATVRIVPVDLNLPQATRIAYLPGTGDAVPEALASINLKPDILTVADLTPAKLALYDTVILGVRTYNAHPDLHGAPTQALLDYARNGGNVLVQYQTAEFTGADAPYPLTLGYAAERVVDETDPVQLLDESAPFLTTPNKITPADFNNWIEERGHGFLSTWDSHYTALTETHDPDQDPQRGGLITANIGKGRWTYCAFALYRQLPEAVPGAFRLFVNLVSPAKSR